jgi:putative peptidoglycan lipid II flippase
VVAVLLLNTISLMYGLIDRHLGSFLAEGSIAALQYAGTVASQPLAICATALGTAIFPYLSDRIGADDHMGAASLFDRAMRWALLGAIPSAVAVAFLGNPIIGLLFERGEFDASARAITGGLLSVYGLWILPAVLGTVIGKIFYAGFRWKPILVAVGVALLFKAGLSYWWVRYYDVMGLVAATTAASAVSAAMMLVLLPAWSTRGHWGGWLRLAVATMLIFAIPCYLASLLPGALPMLSWRIAALLSLVTGIGGGTCGLLILGPRFGVMEMVNVRIAVEAILLHRR